jgi:16S rRNA processing protein RimM
VDETSKLVVIGKIVKPFGIKGELKISPFTESLDAFHRSAEICVDGEPFTVTRIRHHKRSVLIMLDGINTPEQAKEHVGKLIAVNRESLPPCEDDEYYWVDLIGMDVVTTSGINLGKVFNVFRTGAHDVLEVRGDRGEILIPMIDEVVPVVSTEQNLIEVDPLEGLVPDA